MPIPHPCSSSGSGSPYAVMVIYDINHRSYRVRSEWHTVCEDDSKGFESRMVREDLEKFLIPPPSTTILTGRRGEVVCVWRLGKDGVEKAQVVEEARSGIQCLRVDPSLVHQRYAIQEIVEVYADNGAPDVPMIAKEEHEDAQEALPLRKRSPYGPIDDNGEEPIHPKRRCSTSPLDASFDDSGTLTVSSTGSDVDGVASSSPLDNDTTKDPLSAAQEGQLVDSIPLLEDKPSVIAARGPLRLVSHDYTEDLQSNSVHSFSDSSSGFLTAWSSDSLMLSASTAGSPLKSVPAPFPNSGSNVSSAGFEQPESPASLAFPISSASQSADNLDDYLQRGLASEFAWSDSVEFVEHLERLPDPTARLVYSCNRAWSHYTDIVFEMDDVKAAKFELELKVTALKAEVAVRKEQAERFNQELLEHTEMIADLRATLADMTVVHTDLQVRYNRLVGGSKVDASSSLDV
ncbi:uncharacterized protein C8Q71DRAFT_778956 [Rhodofomes roseus]|uniref:Uncharacterized protein n=1 Tax=Rhodofomes roseus TaxID=34475 RepID=A0ABQ8K5D7_9APHY|nr:uncharacterized protein C8Q71DRAFT_778956 [Rhodofomes roseus]KAH9831984.1 hypothetical protein C8Q71DRAFT_778956 [Rhodofomes roseus]